MSSHSISTQEAVAHLGLLVRVELRDGVTAYGRVDAADEEYVYLGRAIPSHRGKIELSSVMVIHCIHAGAMPTTDK